MFRKARRVHFVGIGGAGMSGIAEVLVNLRLPGDSGSDLATNPATRRLRKLGATVHRGHRAEHVRDADVVVVSSAVQPGQPRGGRGAAAEDPGDPARRDAGRADAHEVRRRRGRRARQDDDDGDDRRGARPRPASIPRS